MFKKMRKLLKLMTIIGLFFLIGCANSEQADASEDKPEANIESTQSQDPMENKGIGPITSVQISQEVDAEMAKKGEEVFKAKCSACHKMGKKFIGPDLSAVVTKRSPEWIMNMILNPDEMVKNDPIAKKILMEFNGAPMANQNLSEEEARSVLEYFRSYNTTAQTNN